MPFRGCPAACPTAAARTPPRRARRPPERGTLSFSRSVPTANADGPVTRPHTSIEVHRLGGLGIARIGVRRGLFCKKKHALEALLASGEEREERDHRRAHRTAERQFFFFVGACRRRNAEGPGDGPEGGIPSRRVRDNRASMGTNTFFLRSTVWVPSDRRWPSAIAVGMLRDV